MTLGTRYCPACKESFTVAQSWHNCPDCGETLQERGEFTLDMSRPGHPDLAQTLLASQLAEPVPDEVDSLVGTRLDRYEIERFLGQGGMARVYLARHLTLHRPCAIKVLRDDTVARDANAVESFLGEARAAAGLAHPHVVTIHTIGEDQGRHFIEMEFIEGLCLARKIQMSAPLAPALATRYMEHISSALAAAHQTDLIHRDIKPANVMVTRGDLAKLADFGLAKRVRASHGSVQTGWIAGTPNYMAPELFRGDSASKRSDVYAMGVTYHSLLTGRLPLEANSVGEFIKYHADRARSSLELLEGEVPEGPARVIRRCLEHDPQDRYADAVELHAELRAVYGSLRSLGGMLREALDQENVVLRGDGGRFVVGVSLKQNRMQTVFVELTGNTELREEIVRVFSLCAPVDASYYERALRLNATLAHGAIGISEMEGVPYFVMANAYPRATCDPEELRRTVLEVAQYADQVEQILTGNDRH